MERHLRHAAATARRQQVAGAHRRSRKIWLVMVGQPFAPLRSTSGCAGHSTRGCAHRGGVSTIKREGAGCPSALPIRGSIPRSPRPEQDVKLLSLQARSPSLPPCPPHVASLPAHVCTHVLTACVLCCRSSAAAIAIAIAAISAVRAATAHRQSAAVAVAIAIAATATAVATAAPGGAALFITLFYYCVAF